MNQTDLKKFMATTGVRVIDVASELRMSPGTVMKYLRGERINRVLQDALERYLASKEATKTFAA